MQNLEQRIAAQIGMLTIQNAAFADQVEQLQAQLAAKDAQIKELEEMKAEPKKD